MGEPGFGSTASPLDRARQPCQKFMAAMEGAQSTERAQQKERPPEDPGKNCITQFSRNVPQKQRFGHFLGHERNAKSAENAGNCLEQLCIFAPFGGALKKLRESCAFL